MTNATRFAPRPSARPYSWVGRYYRPSPDVPVMGYADKGEARAALEEALKDLTPGGPVSVNGRPSTFVGFSHTKHDPNYLAFIPRILVRSPSGDVFVSIYDITN